LHGTIGTVNGTLNGLYGTIGTVNGTLNGLHGRVFWCSSTLQGLLRYRGGGGGCPVLPAESATVVSHANWRVRYL
jgi:hypothetical protein